MLIDLHCHTKNVKEGDGKKREPTIELFKEKGVSKLTGGLNEKEPN